jgi:hypothetical protein
MMAVSRGPLNYTTTIDPANSMAECISLLVKHGASAIGATYDTGRPTGLTFQIETVHGMRQYSLPVNVEGTFRALKEAVRRHRIPPRYGNSQEQAERVSWRVLKDWLAAQLALIEAGVAEMSQVMLPYMHIEPGVTVYQAFLENESRLALEAGR